VFIDFGGHDPCGLGRNFFLRAKKQAAGLCDAVASKFLPQVFWRSGLAPPPREKRLGKECQAGPNAPQGPLFEGQRRTGIVPVGTIVPAGRIRIREGGGGNPPLKAFFPWGKCSSKSHHEVKQTPCGAAFQKAIF